MKCLRFVVFLVVVGVTVCQDNEEYEDYGEGNIRRGVRQYNRDDWRPARIAQQENWPPNVEPQEPEVIPRRRRFRKRKRRPPVYDDDFFYPERPLRRRRIRPQRLDQIREPWEEMEAEAISRPNVRRRVNPVYQPPEESEGESERNRGAENEVVETETTSPEPEHNLISDSESEKVQATEEPKRVTDSVEILSSTEPEQSRKYTRIPSSVAAKKTTDRNFEADGDSVESLSSKEIMEAQRRRIALLGAKENKLYSNLVKFDVITEATTERRIFVPAHPKYYTSLNFKPNFNEGRVEHTSTLAPSTSTSTTTSPSTGTTTSPSTSTTSPSTTSVETRPTMKKKGYLPMTNAKLKQSTKVVKEELNFPFPFNFPKPETISLNEILGLTETSQNDMTEESNKNVDIEELNKDTIIDNVGKDIVLEEAGEPLRMPIDIEASVENNKDQIGTSTEFPAGNVTLVTAREEIMEMIKDPSARDSLSRILERRNMTLQELVEQRERGSSQRHLADIFHNKTREPEPKEEPFIGRINAEYFNGFNGSSQRYLADIFHNKTRELEPQEEPFIGRINAEYFNGFKTYERRQKSLEVRGERIGFSSSSTTVKPVEPVTRKMEIVTVPPTEPPPAEEEPAVNSISFPWRQLYPDLFSDPLQSENLESRETIVDEPERHLEDSESGYITSINESFDPDDDIFMNIPSGVRSAMFVSLAIIGLSLVVFVAILVILRCLQKKTRAANYCSSLSSRMRSPMILQSRSTAALKTFMNETLGRKKNYFRSSMQSMSDEIWDTSKERKSSF